MSNKILIVLTSQSTICNTKQKTGAYLSEYILTSSLLGLFEVDFASRMGRKVPLDGVNLEDSINQEFIEKSQNLHKI